MFAIAAHGGAGDWRREKHAAAEHGVSEAVRAGRAILADGGSALEAVIATVRLLEDDPLFNAGTGSCLNIDGVIEMDACVMVGDDLRAGAVAGVTRVRHPIDVARAVMERTDHVLLIGDGATRFARAIGFGDYDPETPDRREAFLRQMDALKTDGDRWLPKLASLLRDYPELAHGTVGAVARDVHGVCAAATSTGGVVLKLVGRVGDAPIPGAGTWADRHGAAGCTGRGEIAMRTLATRRVCDLIGGGASAVEAARRAIEEARPLGTDIGLIVVDSAGRVGAAHGSELMPHAWATEASEVRAAMCAEGSPISA